ncbi:MAG: hypothetical protein WA971_03385, partial [Microbacterium sp.]
VVLLAGAWVASALTPGEQAGEDPFPVTAQVGERGVGRNIDVTVVDARVVHSLTSEEGLSTWSGEGTWLLVEVDAAAVVAQDGAALLGVFLEVDGLTYSASDRMRSFLGTGLVPGVPQRGTVVFELPEDLPSGPAVLAFSLSSDPRADSQIRVPIDLGAVPVQDAAEMPQTEWTDLR